MASLRKAVELRASALMVDVRRTRDDILVIEHDAVRMVDDREVPIREKSLADWRARSADTDSPIATLEDAMAVAAQAGIGLILDFRESGTEALLARAIRQSRFSLDSILVTGADATSRTILRGLDPRIPLGHTLGPENASQINAKLLAALDVDAVTWHHRLLTPPIVNILHLRDIRVYGWYADLAEDMRRLRDTCKVDGVITNAPDLIRTI
ncbi:glycerophosphoryl diester phosphodiesterase [Capsulimonas corticalis]|uniref:Glycerophosphoryl diester phosphodiesterase n=1 Tax=Capsulimonas corticalis TaxID=2219043 RepID=A0A402CV49_9BACT|nr:glycerophosphoryl diester phosphodiesterase [Capsulimonas corticalis]